MASSVQRASVLLGHAMRLPGGGLLLKPFQLEGANFLAARNRALLADEPGVGKTAQVVVACDKVGARRILVVCPSVGIEHWRREFTRWLMVLGRAMSPQVDVVSYEQARQLATVSKASSNVRRYDVLVVDECHYGKNPEAQRTKAIFAKGGLAYYADRIWCLSGTPAPNHAGELWTILRAFGAVGMDYASFVNYFCHVDDQGKVRGTRADHVGELRDKMKPYVLRRKKTDVLPELGQIDVQEWFVRPRADALTEDFFGLEDQEQALRQALAGKSTEEILTFLAGDQEFATLRRYNALLKVPDIFDALHFELENSLVDKVTVYGLHKQPLQILHQAFNSAAGSYFGAVLINGDTPTKERDALVQKWKQPDGPRVMLASIIAAGVVLDFTEAHQGVMIEMDWVNANNQQAMQRMHRHGQTKPVTIRVAIGSEIDEIVSEVLVRKARDFAALFDQK
jgi:SWI/SNF-related matrix-associated actin-dependent regulator 1 of chromatin subfamily A